jgi:hypothetical protein
MILKHHLRPAETKTRGMARKSGKLYRVTLERGDTVLPVTGC